MADTVIDGTKTPLLQMLFTLLALSLLLANVYFTIPSIILPAM